MQIKDKLKMSHITKMNNTRKQARIEAQDDSHKARVLRSMEARKTANNRRINRNLKLFNRQGEQVEA